MENFIKKVAEMRSAQKNYFRYRGSNFLQDAKRLEKEVDAELQRLTNQPVENKEVEYPRLF